MEGLWKPKFTFLLYMASQVRDAETVLIQYASYIFSTARQILTSKCMKMPNACVRRSENFIKISNLPMKINARLYKHYYKHNTNTIINTKSQKSTIQKLTRTKVKHELQSYRTNVRFETEMNCHLFPYYTLMNRYNPEASIWSTSGRSFETY